MMTLDLKWVLTCCFLIGGIKGEDRAMCIQNLVDLSTNNWHATTDTQLNWASSTDGLPEALAGNLLTNGTIFWEGISGLEQAIENYSGFGIGPQLYLYIQYYGHVTGIGRIVVYPYGNSSNYELPPTSNFVWNEALVELRTSFALMSVGTQNFQSGDYFMMQKLIVANSQAELDINQVKNLCI